MAGLSTLRPFPVCFEEVDASMIGPNTYYPVGIDWATLFKWWYRAKVWEIKFTVTATASASNSDSSASVSGFSEITRDFILNPTITDESYYTCKVPNSNTGSISAFDEDDDIGVDSTSNAFIEISALTNFNIFANSSEPVYYHDGQYYPNILSSLIIRATAGTFDGDGSASSVKTLFYNAVAVPPDISLTTPFTIDGITSEVESFMQQEDIDDGGTAITSISIGSIVISIKEYWPYDPGDGGGPIWDSSTGDQLRSPSSVQSW